MARRIQDDPRDRVESPDQWRSAPRPVDWIARCEAVLERDKWCQEVEAGRICGETSRLEVDHIGDPGDHRLENLRALCQPHHRRRSGQQGGLAWQAKRRRLARRPDEKHPGLL